MLTHLRAPRPRSPVCRRRPGSGEDCDERPAATRAAGRGGREAAGRGLRRHRRRACPARTRVASGAPRGAWPSDGLAAAVLATPSASRLASPPTTMCRACYCCGDCARWTTARETAWAVSTMERFGTIAHSDAVNSCPALPSLGPGSALCVWAKNGRRNDGWLARAAQLTHGVKSHVLTRAHTRSWTTCTPRELGNALLGEY